MKNVGETPKQNSWHVDTTLHTGGNGPTFARSLAMVQRHDRRSFIALLCSPLCEAIASLNANARLTVLICVPRTAGVETANRAQAETLEKLTSIVRKWRMSPPTAWGEAVSDSNSLKRASSNRRHSITQVDLAEHSGEFNEMHLRVEIKTKPNQSFCTHNASREFHENACQ